MEAAETRPGGGAPYRLLVGEARAGLASLPAVSVDAVVTDPPAGIAFMGREWDRDRGGRAAWVAWMAGIAAEVLRVTKPGGHAFVWALPRTSHWTATAWEDGGWEVRDRVAHVFGTGFPKSHDVSKALDAVAGAEREVVGSKLGRPGMAKDGSNQRSGFDAAFGGDASGTLSSNITAPATDLAREWSGWGTALKPATEDWWLFRKPLSEPTIAANVARWGTGALNVDGCRVEGAFRETDWHPTTGLAREKFFTQGGAEVIEKQRHAAGRFPPNLVLSHSSGCVLVGTRRVKGAGWKPEHSGCGKPGVSLHGSADDSTLNNRRGVSYADPDGREEVEAWECDASCPVAMLDRQSGQTASSDRVRQNQARTGAYGILSDRAPVPTGGHCDSGGASRFFPTFVSDPELDPFIYCPKPTRAERDAGCESLPEQLKPGWEGDTRPCKADGTACIGSSGVQAVYRNVHPTVKSVALLSWLIKLITPPGGTVLDCFAGSGSTGVAAVRCGFSCILIEQEAEYCEIARARLKHTVSIPAGRVRNPGTRRVAVAPAQTTLEWD